MSKRRLPGPAAMSGMVSLWGASSLIESIQSGTISINAVTSATATITAVDTTRSILVFQNYSTAWQTGGANGRQSRDYKPNLVLTNATTVTAAKNLATAGGPGIVAFSVVQFAPGVLKSVQRGTTSSSAATVTATITEVNTAKSFVTHCGSSDTVTNTYDVPNFGENRVTLTNGTTVTVTNGAGFETKVTSYEVVEFF